MTRQNVTKTVFLNPTVARMKKPQLLQTARDLGLPTKDEVTGKDLLMDDLRNLLNDAAPHSALEMEAQAPARMVCRDQGKSGPQYSLVLVSSGDQIMQFLRTSEKVHEEEDFPDEEEDYMVVEEDDGDVD